MVFCYEHPGRLRQSYHLEYTKNSCNSITKTNLILKWTKDMNRYFSKGDMHVCSVISDFLRPHGLQPASLLCPWDFPGKNTGMGCCFLLQGIEPTSSALAGRFFTTEPPGKPWIQPLNVEVLKAHGWALRSEKVTLELDWVSAWSTPRQSHLSSELWVVSWAWPVP